jgi:hypothetical protein
MRNIIGNAGRKWMLGMTVIAGMLGAGAVAANAAPLEFHGRYVESYVAACPGEGYVWVAGYYNGGYWVPGTWVFRGSRGWDRNWNRGYAYGREFHNEHERDFEGRHFDDRRSDFRASRETGRGYEGGYRGRR